jgi:hypothetical protein
MIEGESTGECHTRGRLCGCAGVVSFLFRTNGQLSAVTTATTSFCKLVIYGVFGCLKYGCHQYLTVIIQSGGDESSLSWP